MNGEKTKEQALAEFRTQSVAGLKDDILKRVGLLLTGSELNITSTNTSTTTTTTTTTSTTNTSTTTITANTASNNTITTNTSANVFKYLPNISDMNIGTDADQKGKSTGKVSVNTENIDGIEQTVINLTVTLIKAFESTWSTLIIYGPLAERAKTATGIRFKIYGDGKPWFLVIITKEAMKDFAFYRYRFDTKKDKVLTIDIPFSKFKQPEWGKKVVFNKYSIESINFERNNQIGSGYLGTATIKIFDIELY